MSRYLLLLLGLSVEQGLDRAGGGAGGGGWDGQMLNVRGKKGG